MTELPVLDRPAGPPVRAHRPKPASGITSDSDEDFVVSSFGPAAN